MATTRSRGSDCASTARSSRCVRQRPTSWSMATCTAPTAITTDGKRRFPRSSANLAVEQTFQLIECFLRLARAERIGIEYGKPIERRGHRLRRSGPRVGGREKITVSVAARTEAIESREIRACLPDGIGGHARQLRDLQAIAAISGPFRDFVQKHDPVLVLDRVEVHVGASLELGRQRG